jgi:hypothetical protein
MPDADFAHFAELVRNLWPRCKDSDQRLRAISRFDDRLKNLSPDYLRAALTEHVRDYPDKAEPHWKMILDRLYGGTSGRNEFETLLRNHRLFLRRARAQHPEQWDGHKPIDEMTDAEIWSHILHGETFPITHDSASGSPHPDPDGRRANLARTRKEGIRYRWQSYLNGISSPVPYWL